MTTRGGTVTRRLGGLAVALCFIVAACGDDESSTSTSETRPESGEDAAPVAPGVSGSNSSDDPTTSSAPSTTEEAATEPEFKFESYDPASGKLVVSARCPGGASPSAVNVPYLAAGGSDVATSEGGLTWFVIAPFPEFTAQFGEDEILLELDLEREFAPSLVWEATCP
jgi:hypothetical protein